MNDHSASGSGSSSGVTLGFLALVVPAVEAVGLYAPSGEFGSGILLLVAIGSGCGVLALVLALRWSRGALIARGGQVILLLVSTLDSLLLLTLWMGRD